MTKSPFGLSADEIISFPVLSHSSYHVFKSVAWLDLLERENIPSAIFYSAIELRYFLEFTMFELLVLVDRGLDAETYRKSIKDRGFIERKLKSRERDYSKLASFSKLLLEVEGTANKHHFWDMSGLLKDWGIASNYLHFIGPHEMTFMDSEWLNEAIRRIKPIVLKNWNYVTQYRGVALFNPDELQLELKRLWDEYRHGKATDAEVKRQLILIQPVLAARKAKFDFIAESI